MNIEDINQEITITRGKIEAEERKIERTERKIEELEEQLKTASQDKVNFIQQLILETNRTLTASQNILAELYRRLPSSSGKILIFLIFSQIFIQSKSMCFSISYLFRLIRRQ